MSLSTGAILLLLGAVCLVGSGCGREARFACSHGCVFATVGNCGAYKMVLCETERDPEDAYNAYYYDAGTGKEVAVCEHIGSSSHCDAAMAPFWEPARCSLVRRFTCR